MNISVVIPNYNGEKILKKNIAKVIDASSNYKNGQVEVIIVDDFSVDNSRQIIEEIQSKNGTIPVKTFYNEKNLGFSSTVNRGVQEAAGEIVILFNTDVTPEDGYLDKVVKHFKNDTVFAVGFMDKSIESGKAVLRGRGLGQWRRGLLIHSAGDISKTNTLWASGGSSAFKKTIWKKLGGFNELYNPFYWEDIDLSYRALKSGYSIHFDPEIIVTHEHEKGAIRTNYTQAFYTMVAHRNSILFVWLNITDLRLILSHIIWLPYHAMKTYPQSKYSFSLAFIQACLKIQHVMKMRQENRKTFKESDKRILAHFTT